MIVKLVTCTNFIDKLIINDPNTLVITVRKLGHCEKTLSIISKVFMDNFPKIVNNYIVHIHRP